jgi:hypothetical protein
LADKFIRCRFGDSFGQLPCVHGHSLANQFDGSFPIGFICKEIPHDSRFSLGIENGDPNVPPCCHYWHYAPQRSEVNSRNPHGWERWLTVALDNQEGGQDTGVVGGAIMGEILACPSAPQLANIHVTLLDCHDVVRLDRLRMRARHGATQEMLSWAAWQRVHAIDPQWR